MTASDNDATATTSSAKSQTAQTAQTAQPTHYLDLHARNHPHKIALICAGRSLTYHELNACAKRVAHALLSLGVQPGDRVAVMAYNSLETLVISCGLSKLNAISVLLNYRLREEEVAYILNDCQPRVTIASPQLVPVVERARLQVGHDIAFITLAEEAPANWLCYADLLAHASEDIPDSTGATGASMIYTSGTTGKPKGAYRPQGIPVEYRTPLIQAFELRASDVHLLAGPYYHSAPNAFVSFHLALGATIVIQPKYDPVAALQLINDYKITTTFMAPILLQRLCDVPDNVFSQYDISSLRSIIVGGAVCPYALKLRAIARFGECLWEFYGATETSFVTILRPEDQLRKPDSCGKAAPWQEIRLLDAAGNAVPDGLPGEMYSRVPWLSQYYNQPEATARAMKNGFFSVGDIAYRDAEGYYYICDRKSDMIVSGGVNIYPAEIEATLVAHPAVADVAVIGVPDEQWGEAVKAVVELRPGANASTEELIAFCKARLADYKKPRSVDFVEKLPRNPAGKLLKRAIREPYWKDARRKI
jgi:acyl-CoA synthetase (AMP-forming)/AMP-acid ligase II